MRELPEQFCENMQRLLGAEYDAYKDSLEQDSYTAVRINTNKISVQDWKQICPFSVQEVPWTEKGYYYDAAREQPSKHPYYYAGLYYIQEPSAMIPASLLPVMPGDRVLDLCAAPGGKATELAAKLQGEGMLVANDISVSRSMSLAKNLQTAGVMNAVVTAETPEHLAEYFPDYFDAVLVDAPCSGEGMFRRDPHMIRDWTERGPEYYAKIQRQILQSAYQMLSAGGYLVYSTCTFSPIENEAVVSWFLSEYPDMQIRPVPRQPAYAEGMPQWEGGSGSEQLRQAVRIFPHRARGEGHFAVLLQKDGQALARRRQSRDFVGAVSFPEAERWLDYLQIQSGSGAGRNALQQKRNQITLVPEGMAELRGLRVIQNGMIVGSMDRGRFEPSPQLALAVQDTADVARVSLASDDIRVIKYLKGETIDSVDVICAERREASGGYVLVCVDGFPLGWAKWRQDGRLKNKYYAGWRMK